MLLPSTTPLARQILRRACLQAPTRRQIQSISRRVPLGAGDPWLEIDTLEPEENVIPPGSKRPDPVSLRMELVYDDDGDGREKQSQANLSALYKTARDQEIQVATTVIPADPRDSYSTPRLRLLAVSKTFIMEGANKGNMLVSKVVLSAEQQEGERADDVELRMLVMTRKMMENMYQRAEDRARATQRGTIRFFP